jgi:hypothetical protein
MNSQMGSAAKGGRMTITTKTGVICTIMLATAVPAAAEDWTAYTEAVPEN